MFQLRVSNISESIQILCANYCECIQLTNTFNLVNRFKLVEEYFKFCGQIPAERVISIIIQGWIVLYPQSPSKVKHFLSTSAVKDTLWRVRSNQNLFDIDKSYPRVDSFVPRKSFKG